MSLFNFSKLPAGVTKAKIVDKSVITQEPDDEIIQLMANDGVNICASACSSCWDVKLPADYEARAEYVSKRTDTGHSSVTEHSNNVFYMAIPKNEIEYLVEILDTNKYLNTCVRFSKKYDYIYMIIGGSWRAWNYLIGKLISSAALTGNNNPLTTRLLNSVYNYCDRAGFSDMVKNHMISDRFTNVNMVANYDNYVNLITGEATVISDKIDCYGLDNINKLISLLIEYCPEAELFKINDLFKFCTCTILFKNLSRTGTHQLVRHRNAITQESQRYVDYSNGSFTSPAKFKPDRYDADYKYPITFGRSSQKMNLQEIGDCITAIYKQLSDKDKLGKLALLKEDARSYLPSSIQCRKIFITYTWDYLFAFLRLREDKHAQAEIRAYATDLGDWFAELYPEFTHLYRKDTGDTSWLNYPIPKKDSNPEDMTKESFIEVMENSIKTETIEKSE